MSHSLTRCLAPARRWQRLALRERLGVRSVQQPVGRVLSTEGGGGGGGGGGGSDHQPLDFSDTKEAFQSVNTHELWRHYLVFKLFSYSKLVDRSQELVSRVKKILGRRLFNRLMKATVYGQFVAGEDLESIRPTVAKLKAGGVRSILDYAVEEDIPDSKEVVMEIRSKEQPPHTPTPTDTEAHPEFKTSQIPGKMTARASARTYFYEDEEKCDQTMKHFLSCIETAADASDGDDAFAAIKLTGLGRVEFLLRLSEVMVGTQQVFEALSNYSSGIGLLEARISEESFHNGLNNMEVGMKRSEADQLFHEIDTDKSGSLNVLEWFNHFQPGKELHKIFRTKKGSKVQPLLAMLDEEEIKQMNSVVRRARTLAECAQDRRVRLMIDAEQTYFQPAIRHVAVNVLMPEFNLSSPVVYNTVQCYLRDSETVLQVDLERSRLSGFCYGVKLVRGAYMEQERELAKEKGYPDPIWPDKKGTDESYHHLVQWLLRQAEHGKLHLMVASHNEETVRLAIQMMQECGVSKSDGTVVFGQLLGMCNHVSFTLGQHGYGVYKYMPYGPVGEVLPYLIRRAQENKGMLDGAKRERELVGREVRRRLGGLRK